MSPGRKKAREGADRLVLGLGMYSHDTAAALMRGGKVLFAGEQERFDRKKHSHALPVEAIRAGLAHIGCEYGDVDDVVVNYVPSVATAKFFENVRRHLPGSLRLLVDFRRLAMASRRWFHRWRITRALGGGDAEPQWHYVRHHVAHGASAFYRSGLEESAVLTCDDMGEFDAVLFGKGEGTRLDVLGRIWHPHSLGAVYSAVTDHLGFRMHSGEGKVMGLAAFGSDRLVDSMADTVSLLPGGEFEVDTSLFRYHLVPWTHQGWTTEAFAERFGPRRDPGSALTGEHKDLARAVQALSDRVILHLCSGLYGRTKVPGLCYAGGSALNGYSNTKILRESDFRSLFIQPAASDGGTALGAALYHSHHVLGMPRDGAATDTYLGPAYSQERCEKALQGASLPYERPQDLTGEVAARLNEGRVVGWFQGRMEYGPRALGNRSILASPCDPKMIDYLNEKVKHREAFRPYAPVVPLDKADRYFDMPCKESPYMLLIVTVREKWRWKLPSVIHEDGTARVQTVDPAINPRMVDLLEAFARLSGVPVLLNTSFNDKGEPIVCTPEDAVGTFKRCGLDDLVLGDFVTKREASPGRNALANSSTG